MLLGVILRENGSLLNHIIYLLIHFLEGPGIIYDVIAYDAKIEEFVKIIYFGCHGNRFLNFKVVFRKNPEISLKWFFIDFNGKKRTSFH